jgi:hypothetical protein
MNEQGGENGDGRIAAVAQEGDSTHDSTITTWKKNKGREKQKQKPKGHMQRSGAGNEGGGGGSNNNKSVRLNTRGASIEGTQET